MVGVNIERGGVEVAWETGDYEGPVEIVAENLVTGDKGVMKDTNDGRHFLTWPPGVWLDEVTVYQVVDGERGDVVDSGVIAVVVAAS